uniref:Immunoglobulin domain-containing protein n=1 Tax=Cyprinodon variegatus TaxID=28743 RepID=A0A3Q2CU80_CYPVA
MYARACSCINEFTKLLHKGNVLNIRCGWPQTCPTGPLIEENVIKMHPRSPGHRGSLLEVVMFPFSDKFAVSSQPNKAHLVKNSLCAFYVLTGNDTTVNKTAYIGETVSITCNYSQADEGSIRTFCKHDGNFSCSNIVTDEKQRGVFEVNISMLTQEDSGRYWCALERDASITCLQDFFLHVLTSAT